MKVEKGTGLMCLDWQPLMPKELTHACRLEKGHAGRHENLFEDPPGHWWLVRWESSADEGNFE